MTLGCLNLSGASRPSFWSTTTTRCPSRAARSAIVSTISAYSGIPEQSVSASFETHTGQDVAEHLFAVGAGLEEDDIIRAAAYTREPDEG